MSNTSPQVESFVVRFIRDAPEQGAWRGVIVHVQSNVEENFSDFADAIAFIARYVPVEKIETATSRPSTEIHHKDAESAETII